MAKRILGAVLVVMALITAGLGIAAAGHVPGNKEIINNAVLVSNGKVLPENEGKAVIVQGTLGTDLPFVDPGTGIKVNSVVAYRKVEKLTIRKETKGEGDNKRIYEYWSWNLTFSENDYGGSKKLIAPNVTLGEFAVAENLLLAVSTPENRTEYTDKKELNQKGWNVFEDDGRTVLYTGHYMPYDQGDVGNNYLDYLHTLRVSYDVMEGDPDFTIIGLQQNGQLVEAPELDLLAVHPGRLSAADLLEYAESSAKMATIGTIVIAVVLAGVGVLLIVKGDTKEKSKKGV